MNIPCTAIHAKAICIAHPRVKSFKVHLIQQCFSELPVSDVFTLIIKGIDTGVKRHWLPYQNMQYLCSVHFRDC